jgi:hypothetical protein
MNDVMPATFASPVIIVKAIIRWISCLVVS